MSRSEIIDIDPRDLRLRPAQSGGADPYKLQTQIARFGSSAVGMPLPWVYRGTDGGLVVYNGVTRATRIARLAPGTTILVEVVGEIKRPVGSYLKIGDILP